MIFTICAVILAALFFYIQVQYSDGYSIWAGATATVFVVLVVTSLLVLVVNTIDAPVQVDKFNSTKQSIMQARLNGVDLEDAAIQKEIISTNRWLAEQQGWNRSMLGWWVPDIYDTLAPIK